MKKNVNEQIENVNEQIVMLRYCIKRYKAMKNGTMCQVLNFKLQQLLMGR